MDDFFSDESTGIVIGFRQTMKGIYGERIRCVLCAVDIDEVMKSQLTAACEEKHVPIRYALTRAELGKKLDVEVPCAVCGLLHNKC